MANTSNCYYQVSEQSAELVSLHLFAVAALRSEPALVAGNAVVVVLVRDERLGADGLLTAVTDKAVLVPRGLAVFQHPGS